jgi:hypothetical protein
VSQFPDSFGLAHLANPPKKLRSKAPIKSSETSFKNEDVGQGELCCYLSAVSKILLLPTKNIFAVTGQLAVT